MLALEQRRNLLRGMRVRARRNLEIAWRIIDPIDRRRALEGQERVLRGTDREWAELNALLRRPPPTVVRLGTPPRSTFQRRSVPSRAAATAALTVKSVDTERRELRGWATRLEIDRVGDIVEPLGCKFELPMPLLHQHRHDAPVGQVYAATASTEGIAIRARLPVVAEPGALRDRVDLAWAEICHGLVRGLSIGFKPKEHELLASGGFRFTKTEIYELSLVTVPACAGAQLVVA